jgi:hypothetical protein
MDAASVTRPTRWRYSESRDEEWKTCKTGVEQDYIVRPAVGVESQPKLMALCISFSRSFSIRGVPHELQIRQDTAIH